MRTCSRSLLVLTLAIVFSSKTSHAADDWMQWRGPTHNGIANTKNAIVTWSQTENVRWRTAMPGPGGATPVLAGNRLFVSSAEKDDLVLLCLNATNGEILWKRTVGTGNQIARTSEGNSASPSPATDGKHVWVNFGTGILACYTVDGEEKWKFQLADRFGAIDIQFGLTSTPVLDGDSLYLQLIHGSLKRDDQTRTGKVIRLNKLTGKTLWEIERVTNAQFECKQSYASPLIYEDSERRFLVVHGADCTTGHDLELGTELWRFGTLNGPNAYNSQVNDPTFRFVASPAFVPGTLIIPTAKAGPTLALKVDADLRGDVSDKASVVKWVCPNTPDVSVPLIVEDLVYLLHKDGKLQCLELATGKEIYFERTHTAQHRTSPVYADGKIYFCDRDGHCTVVAAGREFKILADNDMGELITASPIFANEVLYLRSFDAIYAIR